MSIAPQSIGLDRLFRKWRWSLLRRLRPWRALILPFDNDLKIEVRPIDRLARRVVLDGYSERDLAVFLDRFLQRGMVYLDVGAHFGQYVLLAAQRVGPGGAVHAFEATSATFEQLRANVALNGMSWVKINHNAVYSHSGILELKVCRAGKGEFNSLGAPLRPRHEVVGTEQVAAVSLDAYCEEERLSRVDLIKIDVEGAELHVLRGAQRLLAGADAPVVVCEFNERTAKAMGYSTQDLYQEFRALRYRLYRFDPEKHSLHVEPAGLAYDVTTNLIAGKSLTPQGTLEQVWRGTCSET